MISSARFIIVTAVAVLAGCGRTVGADERICQTPAPFGAPDQGIATAGETIPAAGAHSCLHRWAYRLARAQEDPRLVADATVGACRDAIIAWRNAERSPEMSSEPMVREYALFHVVQARAGNCQIP